MRKGDKMENITQEELNKRIADYHEIISGFTALLKEENKALAELDMDTVGKLFEKKAQTVGVYRGLVAFFIKHQDALNSLSDEEKNSLKEESKTLDELLLENDKLLKTRMETSQTVMDSIINIAKVANNANATSYGCQGRYTPLDNSKNALAVNRTL